MSVESAETKLVHRDLVRLEVDFSPRIQIALQQMKRPVLHELRIHYQGEVALKDLTLFIQIDPAVAEEKVVRIAELEPKSMYMLSADRIALDLSAERLVNQTEREQGRLRIRLMTDGQVIGKFSADIEILAYNEWPGSMAPPESIAAFVTPNHPAISKWLDLARVALRATGDQAGFEGYQSGDTRRVAELAAAIYGAVARAGVDYSNPAASFQESGQKVRTADQVLGDRLGTCLDLSVLMASALEQVGLHPLIILVEGHAFPGVWLTEWQLPEPFTDDPLLLYKRIKIGECLVFDSSAATAGRAFAEACQIGKKHLEDVRRFHVAVDIRAARGVGVGPLRLQRESAYKSVEPLVSEDQRALWQRPSELVPSLPSLPALAQAPSERIDNWKRRLLDLSLRNRLLNHKDTKSVLPIFGQNPGVIEDYLDIEDKLECRPRSSAHLEKDGEERFALAAHEAKSGRLLIDLAEKEFESRAIEVYRRNRQIEQESGTSALFLALGMLQWFESPTSTQMRLAPVILIPISLERDSVSGPFRITRTDQEPLINVTLVEKLRNDFGIELPSFKELPEDHAGIDVDGILRSVLHAIKDVDRFDVIWDATIGIYEFQKFMLWLDLTANTDKLLQNHIVRHILEAESSEFPEVAPFPGAHELDHTRPAHDDLSVVEADSSQLSAIFAAVDGNSFVLQGPPGTGKSQTITNLIAQLLGRGKTVLFVSEKRAALEVVEARLKQVGLGPFSLEVHSDKASRTGIVRQLEEPYNYAWQESPEQWRAHADRLQREKSALNNYTDSIHTAGPFGETLYQAISKITGLRHAPRVDLTFEVPPDRDEFLEMQRCVEDLRVATRTLGPPTKNAFYGARLTTWTPNLQRAVEELSTTLTLQAAEFDSAITEMARQTNIIDGPPTRNAISALSQVMTLLIGSPSPTSALLSEPRASLDDMVQRAVAYLGQRRGHDIEVQQFFLPTLYEQPDLVRDRALVARWSKAFFLFAFLALFFVRRRLQNHARTALPANDRLHHVLESATQLVTLDAKTRPETSEFARVFGHHWKGEQTDVEALTSLWQWCQEFRQVLIEVREVVPGVSLERLCRLAILSDDELAPETSTGKAAQRFRRAKDAWEATHPKMLELLAIPYVQWHKLSLTTRFEAVRQWKGGAKTLRDWTDWYRAANQLGERSLAPLVTALEQRELDHDTLVPAFERGLRAWWIQYAMSLDQTLANFRGFQHDELIRRFRNLDQEAQDLARREVQARLASRLPDRRAPGEMEILRREFKKKSAHKPIRRLFAEAPEALRRLKPCVLMSPLSVARYLDPGSSHFDVVVFDEASQIPPWDAIGAIARADQAIVVGDSRQLPPTNFFSAKTDEDFEEEDLIEFESILDQSIVSGIPELTLDWHYRSRHESLIAFSNHHYYNNRLHIFPSPYHLVPQLGVKWVEIKDGFYDRGGSRVNRAEAEAVTKEIVRRLKDPVLSDKSIGVVTFSMAQQRCIEDLTDQARRQHPEIERFFGDGPESVFIKNLESVQGDERDVMFFSVGYGPDQAGRVTMNFGPLNREGGERRLNVAVTRAKELLIVFSTLSADQIDLTRTQALGVRHLKNFLQYAAVGAQALVEAVSSEALNDFDSPFEREVSAALKKAGWTTHSQVGVAGYRVDLAVVDPARPGAYLLGIECDGATYHSAKNARDRDRIRQAVLENLGWTIHRIWSTEWWHAQDKEIQTLLAKLTELKHRRRPLMSSSVAKDVDVGAGKARPAQDVLPPTLELGAEPIDAKVVWPSNARPWRVIEVPVIDVSALTNSQDFHAGQPGRRTDIQEQINALILKHGPLNIELLARSIATAWGHNRLTKRVRSRVRSIVEAAPALRLYNDAVWSQGVAPQVWDVFRYVDDESPPRDVTDLVATESENALHWVVTRALSIDEDDAIREAAGVFGFSRAGSRIQDHFQDAIESLVQRGLLIRQDGKIKVSSDA